MRLIVTSFKGLPPLQPIEAEFGQSGGSIGREPGNQLVLPDPERHISRLHAQVIWERGVFLIEDHGGNPTLINGRPVGRGNRTALANGDLLAIGGYELRAEVERAGVNSHAAPTTPTVASDPLGLFGSAPSSDPFGAPAMSAAATPPIMPPRAAAPMPAPVDDPFAVFAAAVPTPPAATNTAPLPDPFAAPPPAPKPSAPLGMDLNLAPAASVDDLFGLGGGKGAADPFAGTALSSHTDAPASAPAAIDPLALFGAAPAVAPSAAPLRDDAPMLGEAFTPPRPLAPQSAEPPAAMAPPPQPAPAPEPAPGIVFSWSEPATPSPATPSSADTAERVVPAAGTGADPGVSVRMESTPFATPVAAPAQQAPAPTATPPSAPAPAPLPAGNEATPPDVLLAAFQRGLGFPLQPADGLSPERMEQIGRVLRESVAGTMALLTARALTKREIRAEVTMIVSKENNPLKFAPDVEFALVQLLAPQGRGFMEPVKAMRDAYDDLRSHQFGFMAGMRAALTGVLARFKPEQLEGRISARGFLDNVLPGSRKARLWDLYEQHYADISREAEDDFQTLFGHAFLKAYEEQIDRLASDPGRE
ncbi:hypothetical protein GCM10025771_31380 [Niveibacterium umoris]|uniref:Type VI secretion system FHA domain protein n=1 Tax=Niveibacterium umoris TaxID=1193620 RepID=A0A840BL98_9RHOO|nr:type VI secretion system-associated FHA domain protein TagH [Niveibacterium umoris]MBB4011666.1 type VI secretion system FHA domain protein [Niveibacterium umoris]